MVNRAFVHMPESTLEMESSPLLQVENKELAQGLLTGFPSPWAELVTRARDYHLSIVGKLESGGTETQICISRYFISAASLSVKKCVSFYEA